MVFGKQGCYLYKAYCKSTDGNCSSKLMCRKGKCMKPRTSIPVKDKCCLFHTPKGSSLVNLPLGHWPMTAVNDATWWVQCRSLLLLCLKHSSSFSQVSLRKWKSMLMNQYLTSVSATTATSLIVPLGNGGDKHRWRQAVYRKVNNTYCFFNSPSSEVSRLLVIICTTFFCYLERYIHVLGSCRYSVMVE